MPLSAEHRLRVPLKTGGSIDRWRLGSVHEQRYDVRERTMEGEMDPFFFLTKDRNFIPHEYPCRTDFIAEFRGRRPSPATDFEPSRVWLPFGSPRVDLRASGSVRPASNAGPQTVLESAGAADSALPFRDLRRRDPVRQRPAGLRADPLSAQLRGSRRGRGRPGGGRERRSASGSLTSASVMRGTTFT